LAYAEVVYLQANQDTSQILIAGVIVVVVAIIPTGRLLLLDVASCR
jgi:hypothetical protein